VAGLSAASILAFLGSPYGLIADVKMLNFFRYMSRTAAITLGVLGLLSFFYQNFWCRYLCPYGALMGLASVASPAGIRREPERCIDCAKCSRACPALLPVDKLVTVRSAECMSCMECVAVCPARGALEMSFPRRRAIPVWVLASGIVLIFAGIVIFARLGGVWDTQVRTGLYYDLIRRVEAFSHPGL